MSKVNADIILKKSYDNLPQRVLASCIFCMSEPNYIASEIASRESQILLHNLFTDILKNIYNSPRSFGLEIISDDSYALPESQNRKPELTLNMKQIYYQLYELFSLLYFCGLHGESTDNTLTINEYSKKLPIRKKNIPYFNNNVSFLANLGINLEVDKLNDMLKITSTEYQTAFHALNLLSALCYCSDTINKQNMFDFVFCIFNKQHDYLLRKIEKYFYIENNYFNKCFDQYLNKNYIYEFEYYASPDVIGFHYTCYNDITGFKIQFASNKKYQIFFRINRIIGAKFAILDYENLSEDVQAFLRSQLFECCNCGSCMKNGKKITLQINHNNITHNLCVGSIWMARDGGIAFRSQKHLDSIHAFIDILPMYAKSNK